MGLSALGSWRIQREDGRAQTVRNQAKARALGAELARRSQPGAADAAVRVPHTSPAGQFARGCARQEFFLKSSAVVARKKADSKHGGAQTRPLLSAAPVSHTPRLFYPSLQAPSRFEFSKLPGVLEDTLAEANA